MRNWRELVCVVGMGVVLLLCIGASDGRGTARQTRCLDNLRRLYALTVQYEADFGRTPPPVVKGKPLFWDAFLRPRTEDRLVFACPSDARNACLYEPESPLFPAPPQVVASYGMNFFFTDDYAARAGVKPPALGRLTYPAQRRPAWFCSATVLFHI